MLQVVGAAPSVPLASEIVSLPAVPVTVPPHCDGAALAASVSPAGKVSVKASPLCAALPFGLVGVKVRVDMPPAPMLVGLNPFVNVSKGGPTVNVAMTPLVFRLGDTPLKLMAL